jgi:YidC/Oxa1 family membrane protein insertase
MDTRNVIAAISLSTAVIILYSLWFSPSPEEIKRNQIKQEQVQKNQKNSDTPSLDKNENFTKLSRQDALKENDRVQFENGSVVGSISLKGATIDDLTFKEYNVELNGEEKVTLLSPRNVDDGYLIESGFVTSNKNIDVPDASTIWEISGNKKLTTNNPVKLTWSNSQDITFEKHISLDDKFLFTVKEKIINRSDKSYNFYSYGQIIRNKLPEISGFYILHEGFLSVLDDELIEEDYDDIQEKKFTRTAQEGFVGISDKYWITSIIPQKGKEFKTTFDYKNKFRANYISTQGTEVGPNSSIEEKIQIIVAAKRVNVIDGYAENLKINKFDLAIDWGFLYWATKPLYFALDYFFKLLGNYGLAIIAVTVCIRIAFFPLANFSFKSMGKMKLLAPEMARLKEVHKDDKMALQKSMMALYKKEKVNPMSGCLPVLVQIPIFFAIYKILFVTLETRHMPFYGYLKDLSSRDPTSIFNLFGLVPWDPPSFLMIGALPIAMGISMWLQQKLNPSPPDPLQKKLFAFFPLVLTVILAPFASGLVLYWTTNNILNMGQQYIVQRKMTVKTT